MADEEEESLNTELPWLSWVTAGLLLVLLVVGVIYVFQSLMDTQDIEGHVLDAPTEESSLSDDERFCIAINFTASAHGYEMKTLEQCIADAHLMRDVLLPTAVPEYQSAALPTP
jgi:hypothetical protein